MRFLDLTSEEIILIDKLYKKSDNSVVRERCMFLKLSSQKHTIAAISTLLKVGRWRITQFFNAWESAESLENKQKTLGIKPGRGAKLKLEKVAAILPDLVKENSRNLNVILDILEKNHDIKICKLTLQNFLKIQWL
jgi:transposase